MNRKKVKFLQILPERLKISLLVFLMLVFYCSREMDDDLIVEIDDFPIYMFEFQYRYNFNPHLHKIKDTALAKKMVLSALIAEKVLYLETKTSMKMDSISGQYLWESMIEQIRRDSIESTISVSESEIWQELDKCSKEINISYIAVESREEVLELEKSIKKSGSFDKTVKEFMNKKGWKNEPIPAKTIRWGEEEYQLEDAIFTLQSGEISRPVFAHGEFYIIRVDTIIKKFFPAYNEFMKRKSAIDDRLRRKKIANRYKQFYQKNITKRLGSVNWEEIKDIIMEIRIFEGQDGSLTHLKEMPMSELHYRSFNDQFKENWYTPVVHFNNGDIWVFGELIRRLKTGPYIFDFKEETYLIRSLITNIKLLLEHQAIYEMARELGYENHVQVKREYSMWRSYLYASNHRYQLLQKVTVENNKIRSVQKNKSIQGIRLEYFDRYITRVSKNYQIRINKKRLNKIPLKKWDMVVLKRHFPGRPVAPQLEPLFGMPQWAEVMDRLLAD